jgi:hypothetical protein
MVCILTGSNPGRYRHREILLDGFPTSGLATQAPCREDGPKEVTTFVVTPVSLPTIIDDTGKQNVGSVDYSSLRQADE